MCVYVYVYMYMYVYVCFFVLDKENFLDENWKKLNPDGAYSRCAFLSQLLRLSHFQIQSVLILVFLPHSMKAFVKKTNQKTNLIVLLPQSALPGSQSDDCASSSLICTTTGPQSALLDANLIVRLQLDSALVDLNLLLFQNFLC